MEWIYDITGTNPYTFPFYFMAFGPIIIITLFPTIAVVSALALEVLSIPFPILKTLKVESVK